MAHHRLETWLLFLQKCALSNVVENGLEDWCQNNECVWNLQLICVSIA